MPKLPHAPDLGRLQQLAPSVITIDAGTRLHRIYRRGGARAALWNAFRYFGPTSARFDHQRPDRRGGPMPQDRGILYAATDITTAVAEVFQARRTVNRTDDSPWLVSFSLVGTLTLLNLTDTFCVRAGASMKLVSGPTLHAQRWSRGFYECFERIQGIYYPSSLTNRPVMALYERADGVVLPEMPSFHRAIGDPLLIEPLRNVCKEIGYDFV